MSARDYATEMRGVIDSETGSGPYVSRVIAAQIVEKLSATDRELLTGWLHAQAEQLIWQAINDRDRSTRANARTAARRSVFAAAADAHDAGDSTHLRGFLDVPYVVSDGTRRLLADLRADDLRFVAESYEATARKNSMNAAFMRALAKKVGNGRVVDHFSNETLADLWRSLGGE